MTNKKPKTTTKRRQKGDKVKQSITKKTSPAPVSPILTERMKGETQRQYAAWLLYYQICSLRKLREVWDTVGELEGGEQFVGRIGKRPGFNTIAKWSIKFQWVKRNELQFEETLSNLAIQTKRIDKERKDKVAQLFKVALEKKRKQLNLKPGEAVSDTLIKYLWEMHRTEMGLVTGRYKHEISKPIAEEDQVPLSPDEVIMSKKMTELEKEHNAKIR